MLCVFKNIKIKKRNSEDDITVDTKHLNLLENTPHKSCVLLKLIF